MSLFSESFFYCCNFTHCYRLIIDKTRNFSNLIHFHSAQAYGVYSKIMAWVNPNSRTVGWETWFCWFGKLLSHTRWFKTKKNRQNLTYSTWRSLCQYFSNARCVTAIIPFLPPYEVKTHFSRNNGISFVVGSIDECKFTKKKRKFDMYFGEKRNIYGEKNILTYFLWLICRQ